MKPKNAFVASFLLLSALFLLAGCWNPFDRDGDDTDNQSADGNVIVICEDKNCFKSQLFDCRRSRFETLVKMRADNGAQTSERQVFEISGLLWGKCEFTIAEKDSVRTCSYKEKELNEDLFGYLLDRGANAEQEELFKERCGY